MKEFIGFYIYLLLTLIGFITPVTGILLSIFQVGVDRLKAEYENKASRYDDEIQGVKKGERGDITKVRELRKSLKKQSRRLWRSKMQVSVKLWLLNPRKQTAILFILLLFSFIFANSYFLTIDDYFYEGFFNLKWLKQLLLISSVVIFVVAIIDLYLLTGILIEVRKITSLSIEPTLSKNEIDIKDCLEFHVNGKCIQENHPEIIVVTKNNPMPPICLFNRSGVHTLNNIAVGMNFPSNKFQLTTSDTNTIISKKDKYNRVEWNIENLSVNDNIYMTSLKFIESDVGEYQIDTEICVDTVKITRMFKIKIVPENTVKNG